ncbi:MAG TPA: hypothetical protein PLN69_10790 [bacterium]|nr:hypothetical protein [bacterium]
MDIGNVESANQTAALSQALTMQNAGLYVLLQTLQSIEDASAQLLESLGVGQNINIVA